MGIASKRGQMKYVRLLLWGMYEEMAHSFFKVGQCPLGHNWSTYFTKDHCTLVFSKYIHKIIFKTLIHLKLCQRHNGPKALSTFTQNDTFSWKQKLQQALKSWSSWLLFCSDINKMAFVFIRHQQHDFSFVLASTTWFSFVLMSTTWLSKLKTVGKARKDCVTFGEAAWIFHGLCFVPASIFTRRGHISQVSQQGLSDRLTQGRTRQGNDRTWVL